MFRRLVSTRRSCQSVKSSSRKFAFKPKIRGRFASERSVCLRGDTVQLRRSVNGQRATNDDDRLASTRVLKEGRHRNSCDVTRISLRSIAGDVVRLPRWYMSMHVHRQRVREKVTGERREREREIAGNKAARASRER